jgi:hypothetical protein
MLVDVSHVVEHGMITYRGLPAPLICDFLSREQSRSLYDEGTEFHLGKIEMVANTGTYLDSPFHRYASGKDISELPLDVRNRPAEFAERGPIPKDELMRRLHGVVEEAKRGLAGVTARQLVEVRRIQGFDVTVVAAIFDSVPHFRGHTQEIVHMTRLQLGDAYKFAWTPSTREQGALA